ncbi:hypothetical protein HPB48_007464 [Haemaphysalis longicornis]|uniref:Major facilitator superfamily (MFS) profile domain-containing protein n=1 Tax=Haemaphysalis longicornis TaxID=44386 RepID=A0A9J6G5Y8_HAELO|nr:hypothetical protein HPB48_007464 [Haemaphysalis longicornis]
MDSPRSWLVAAGCCWVNVFAFCMLRSTAVVYVNIIDTFETTREEAAWPVTLAVTCFFIAALVGGILARHFPVWKITFTACIVAAVAVCSCYFATGVTYLALVYGIVQGLGVGHLTLSSTVINQHFTKYRAVASGINMAGYSISGLVFPPTMQFFFDEYGFRGAFLLSGGTMLNAAAGTLLQRIPPPVQSETIIRQTAQACDERDDSGDRRVSARDLPERNRVPACLNDTDTHKPQDSRVCEINDVEKPSSSRLVDTHYRGYSGTDGVVNKGFEPTEHTDANPTLKHLTEHSCKGGFVGLMKAPVTHKKRRALSTPEAVFPIRDAFRVEDTVCKARASQHPAEHGPTTTIQAGAMFEQQSSRCEDSETRAQVSVEKIARRTAGGMKRRLQAIKELLSFLGIIQYYAVLFSKLVIVTNSAFYMTVIIDFALDRGIDRWKALTLISAYAALDLTARFSTGWITDRELISRSTLMAFCLTVWTAADFCLAFFSPYAVLLAVSAVAGWCNGSTLPMIPVLYMEIMDISHFSVAYGLGSFIAGLTGLARPALTASRAMDSTRSWVVAGACFWINVFAIPMLGASGVIYVNILKTFDVTREQASWPVSLTSTFYLISGILGGMLNKYITLRAIVIISCALSALLMSACFFATGILFLIIILGVFNGIVVGGIRLTCVVVNKHFLRYRASASGINLAGLSVGGFLFSPLLQFLFDQYGFRGGLLICGGISLNSVAAALLCGDPEEPKTSD